MSTISNSIKIKYPYYSLKFFKQNDGVEYVITLPFSKRKTAFTKFYCSKGNQNEKKFLDE